MMKKLICSSFILLFYSLPCFSSSPSTLAELMKFKGKKPSLDNLFLQDGRRLVSEIAPDLVSDDGSRGPRLIFAMRHGEKTGDTESMILSRDGQERAAALAAQITLDEFYPSEIDEIYAAASFDGEDDQSIRSIETAMPYAILHQKQIYAFIHKDNYDEMAEFLKTRTGKNILLFWEHKRLHALVEALGVESPSPVYPDDEFGQVWKISDLKSVEVYHQDLMYNDALLNEQLGVFKKSSQGIIKYSKASKNKSGKINLESSFKARDDASINCDSSGQFMSKKDVCSEFSFHLTSNGTEFSRYVDGVYFTPSSQQLRGKANEEQETYVERETMWWIASSLENQDWNISEESKGSFCELAPIVKYGDLDASRFFLSGLPKESCLELQDSYYNPSSTSLYKQIHIDPSIAAIACGVVIGAVGLCYIGRIVYQYCHCSSYKTSKYQYTVIS